MARSAAIALRASCKGIAVALATMVAASTSAHGAETGMPSIAFKGLIDARGVLSSGQLSTDDRGLGKTRFGGDANGSRPLARIAEAALVIEPRITWDLSAVILLTAAPEQRTVIDVAEAYLQYKPAPTGNWGLRARAGLFFPPISLENTGLAWTSPYTITPSAINSWVGEELRTIGGEATLIYRNAGLEVAATFAAYKANDPTGTMLAWRGWSFNDRKPGVIDRIPLPAVRIIRPNGILSRQEPFDRPFVEIDKRVGYYGAVSLDYRGYGKISVLHYDNHADDRMFHDGQWPWRTSFWSVGLSTQLSDIEILAQGMAGTTTVITTSIGPIVGVDFRSAYGLISKAWANQRLSFRADWFETKDFDVFLRNDGNEHGYALTLAYTIRPKTRQRLTLEVMYIDSTRPERRFLNASERTRETQVQISYRFFL